MINKHVFERMRNEVRRVLMAEWDPICIRDVPEAADEYDMYINGVLKLLMEFAPDAKIGSYLRDIKTKKMGMTDLNGNPLLPEAERAKAVTAVQSLRPLFFP